MLPSLWNDNKTEQNKHLKLSVRLWALRLLVSYLLWSFAVISKDSLQVVSSSHLKQSLDNATYPWWRSGQEENLLPEVKKAEKNKRAKGHGRTSGSVRTSHTQLDLSLLPQNWGFLSAYERMTFEEAANENVWAFELNVCT